MNLEIMKARINWHQAIAEVVLIGLGVLAALAVDSWWAEREAEERERVQLEALGVEMQDNVARLDGLIELQDGLLEAQRRLLRVMHGVEPVPSSEETANLIYHARRFFRLEPVTGAYDALVASGDLRLVGSGELRAALTRFYGEVARGYEDEQLSTLYRIDFTKAIVEAADFLALVPLEEREIYGAPESRHPINLAPLLDSRALAGYLVLLLRTEFYITNDHYKRLRNDASDMVRLIDIEIANLDPAD